MQTWSTQACWTRIDNAARAHAEGGSELAMVMAWESLRYCWIDANDEDLCRAYLTSHRSWIESLPVTDDHTTRITYAVVMALFACNADADAVDLAQRWRDRLMSEAEFSGWARLAVLATELRFSIREVDAMHPDLRKVKGDSLVAHALEIRDALHQEPESTWHDVILDDIADLLAGAICETTLWYHEEYRSFYRVATELPHVGDRVLETLRVRGHSHHTFMHRPIVMHRSQMKGR